MGTKERRERERRELRKKILDAARALFVEQGYDAVTMRKIAAAIEYSPTAIYLHFEDKMAVMRALCDQDYLALAKRFRKLAAVADPVERLRQAGLAYAEFGFKHPNHYQWMFMTPHPHNRPEDSALEQGNPEVDAYAFLMWTVGQAIAAGRFRPEIQDVELVSQVIWSGIHGVVSLRLAKSKDEWVDWKPQRQAVAMMADVLVRGFLRETEAEG
jgi:AcrR family transcriptional regulator